MNYLASLIDGQLVRLFVVKVLGLLGASACWSTRYYLGSMLAGQLAITLALCSLVNSLLPGPSTCKPTRNANVLGPVSSFGSRRTTASLGSTRNYLGHLPAGKLLITFDLSPGLLLTGSPAMITWALCSPVSSFDLRPPSSSGSFTLNLVNKRLVICHGKIKLLYVCINVNVSPHPSWSK